MAKVTNSPFFIGSTLRESWKLLRENLVEVVAIYVVGAVVPQIVFFIIRRVTGDDGYSFLMFLNQLVAIIVSMGVLKAFLDVVQGRKIDVSFLWQDPRRVVNFIAGTILYALIVLGGLILLIVPGVIWGIKFRYFTYLIIEENLGPIEALKKSGQMTQGVKWDLLAFDLTMAVIVILGLLALVVGLLVATPLVALAQVVVYLKLAERAKK